MFWRSNTVWSLIQRVQQLSTTSQEQSSPVMCESGHLESESGSESRHLESESSWFRIHPLFLESQSESDSYFLALNPNPAQKALNPDLNPNPDSDSHITDPVTGLNPQKIYQVMWTHVHVGFQLGQSCPQKRTVPSNKSLGHNRIVHETSIFTRYNA